MSLSCAAQQLAKENARDWAKGKVANDGRECSFLFQLLSLPKEKYLYISVCSLWSCMPVLHSHETILWRNAILKRSAIFLTKHPLQQKKLLSLTSWWLLLRSSNVFSGRNLLVKVAVFYTKYVSSTMRIMFWSAAFLSSSVIMFIESKKACIVWDHVYNVQYLGQNAFWAPTTSLYVE